MKLFIFLVFAIAGFESCNNDKGYKKAEDAQDAGREFIRASLDGNYEKARFYLLNDSTNTNIMLLDKWKKDYNMRKTEDKVSYKDASIIAISVEPTNDSTVNFRYTNTFEPKDTTTIKIVRINGEWLVDLKDIH
jgi:hypothetical protein